MRNKQHKPVLWHKPHTLAVILGSLGLLLLLFCLSLFVFSPRMLPVGSTQPRILSTPVRSLEIQQTNLSLTPTPPPIELIIHREYPQEAVMLTADGKPLFALESRTEALSLLQEYLSYWATQPLPNGERLLKAFYSQQLELSAPDGKVDLLKAGEAYSLLLKDSSLLLVQRTTIQAKVEQSTVEVIHSYQPSLLEGTRFIPTLGSPGYTLIYSELSYNQDTALEVRETNRFSIGSGAGSFVWEEGAMSPIRPRGTATEMDYPSGRPAETLSFIHPVKSTPTRYYGYNQGVMHYHLEYAAKKSEAVVAPEGGVVIYAGERGDMGLTVDILHDEQGFITRIYHLGSIQPELFQRVKKGEKIGTAQEHDNAPLCFALLVDNLPTNPIWYIQKP